MPHAMSFLAQAPSNIAIVKYMGKKDTQNQIPQNPSLSLTLKHLCTFAEIERHSGHAEPRWLPETPRLLDPTNDSLHNLHDFSVPTLNETGLQKVIAHLKRCETEIPKILSQFQISPRKGFHQESVVLRSVNTFPEASGIASSASSFAAITLAMAYSLAENPSSFSKIYESSPGFMQALASVARMGSGSACRSFQGPWVLWNEAQTQTPEFSTPPLVHFVLLVSSEQKSVSSSQAHLQVKTSPLWTQRVERAQTNLQELLIALKSGNIAEISTIAWKELWDMHELFHTARPPFSYLKPLTTEILDWLSDFVQTPSPPIVTLDAGPNVHLLVESDWAERWNQRIRERFPALIVLRDHQGQGACVVRFS